jgi:hypothetical protein
VACGLAHAGLSAGLPTAALLLPNVVDNGTDAALGQRPALVGQPADELELQPLVDFLGEVVVAEHVGGKRES